MQKRGLEKIILIHKVGHRVRKTVQFFIYFFFFSGDRYYSSMTKNLKDLGKKIPALKSIVGPKALLKDLSFSLKTFSYMPNVPKRNTFDPYLDTKETLNGDHSETVDILASQDISLEQLTDLYMASKLLGYEGHEKLLDILSIMQVGVPDALNFATDLTAFFEENCKAEVMAEKSKAQNIQGLLIIAQKYLIKSQLFGKDEAFNVPKVGNYSNATAPKTSASASAAHNGSHPQVTKTVNGHHRIATSSFDNYAEESSVDVLKIEAMEKNLSLLNQEVKKIKDLEEGDRQIRTDIGHMKRDYEAKQTHLKQALKPLQDKLAELTHDLDSLKTEVKTMQGLKLAPGVAPFKGNGASGKPACVYVRVAYGHNRNEVHEFPTDENGNLSFTAVNAVYPG